MEVRINKFEERLRREHPNDPAYLDSMLSRFNKGVQASGLFRELKKREFYIKPSLKKSKKKQNKLIKSRQERNALRKKGLQGLGGRGYRVPGKSTKNNKGQRPGRVFKLHDNKDS